MAMRFLGVLLLLTVIGTNALTPQRRTNVSNAGPSAPTFKNVLLNFKQTIYQDMDTCNRNEGISYNMISMDMSDKEATVWQWNVGQSQPNSRKEYNFTVECHPANVPPQVDMKFTNWQSRHIYDMRHQFSNYEFDKYMQGQCARVTVVMGGGVYVKSAGVGRYVNGSTPVQRVMKATSVLHDGTEIVGFPSMPQLGLSGPDAIRMSTAMMNPCPRATITSGIPNWATDVVTSNGKTTSFYVPTVPHSFTSLSCDDDDASCMPVAAAVFGILFITAVIASGAVLILVYNRNEPAKK